VITLELISNCGHFGSTYIAFVTSPENIPVTVVKASFEKEGVESLKNEIRGLRWYAARLNIDPDSVVSHNILENQYANLSIPFHQGSCGNPYLPIEKNYTKIINAIQYYKKIFGDDYTFSHGDYSLVNMVFRQDEIHWLIDWEHFNNQLPREFDVMNCILEVCYFNYKRKKQLSCDDIHLLKKLLAFASDEIEFCDMNLNTPAKELFTISDANRGLFGAQVNKYVLMGCPKEDIAMIDYFFQKYT
jgi:hypothetical protein